MEKVPRGQRLHSSNDPQQFSQLRTFSVQKKWQRAEQLIQKVANTEMASDVCPVSTSPLWSNPSPRTLRFTSVTALFRKTGTATKRLQFLIFSLFSLVFFPFLGFDGFHWYLQRSDLHGVCCIWSLDPQARDILNTRDDENGHEMS